MNFNLKEESISRRIHLSMDRHDVLKNAPAHIRHYFEEVIRNTYKGLEMDYADPHTSSENLRFAINVTLYDDFNIIYQEALKEAK